MASSKEYLDFILEQLSELDEITYRGMMGEYIIIYPADYFAAVIDDILTHHPPVRYLIKL